MPEDALLELPELGATEDEHVEGAETDETATEGATTTEGEGETATPVTALFQPDGKKLDPTVSAALAKLKTENPTLGKLMAKAVYKFAELEREFPGGLTEAREIRDKVEELGGLDEIGKKTEALKDFDELVDLYKANDPAFVEDLVASYPENFAVLAPVFVQKWAETNPEAYAAHIGRAVFSDMQKAQVPLMLMRLVDVLGDNAKAVELVEQLNGYLGGFKALAEKKPSDAPKVTPKRGENDIGKREEELRSREWRTERDASHRLLSESEYTKALAGRKPDTEERAQIRELFALRAGKLADGIFKDWRAKSQGYITRNDKPGYLRYMQSIYARVVPEAMASAVKSTLKGGAAAPAKKVAVGGAPLKAADGFAPVAKEPGTWDIDYGRTSKSMLDKNQAILKDGKKVVWK